MKIYETMPQERIEGWHMSTVSHSDGQEFDFHYHGVEEWLEVLEGEMRFIATFGLVADRENEDGADRRVMGPVEYPVLQGQALMIPQGEVHFVRIGSAGVRYRMWVPQEEEGPFRKELDATDKDLMIANLAVPEAENGTAAVFSEFFGPFLSRDLTFRTAKGQILSYDQFMHRDRAGVKRFPSDAVRVLHKSDDSVLLSTVVHTEPEGGGKRSAFTNVRLFTQEDNAWKCRAWLNYPELAAP